MNAETVIKQCHDAGIPLSANGDKLRIGVPAETVPRALLAELKANKTELLMLLARSANDVSVSEPSGPSEDQRAVYAWRIHHKTGFSWVMGGIFGNLPATADEALIEAPRRMGEALLERHGPPVRATPAKPLPAPKADAK